ncbi:MAG: porin [Bryobacterales bacterium]|nr:porin [Bryobacterales bacterium]
MRLFQGAALLAAAAPLALAQAQAPSPATSASTSAPWSIGPVQFSGLIDGYYNYTPNHPASRTVLYRNFDVRANSISLNMAELNLDMAPEPLGFKLSLGAGRAFDLIHFADTANGFDSLRYVPQAYLSYKPVTAKGLQLDFGKFYTSAGAELTETHLGWNYSRALMYANGPYYHFGLRTTMPLSKNFTAGFQVVNGWNNVEDNNSGKTVGVTTVVTVRKFVWSNVYYAGPETSAANEGFRNFNSTVFTLNPSDKVSLYGQFDYGTEKARVGGSFDWITYGGAARFQVTPRFALSPRAEYYYDKDGFITGTVQKLKEFTITG